jgi:SH3 domain protein
MPVTIFHHPGFRPVGHLLASGLLCVATLMPCQARAESAYIIDEIVVPLRETPCSSCRVVHPGLRSGFRVKTLEATDGWSRVETGEGLTGWLPSRYLTSQPIAREQLAALQAELERLKAENPTQDQNRSDLIADDTLTTRSESFPDNILAFGDLPEDTRDLYVQNQELLTHNKILQSEIDVLHATKEELENNEVQRWFIFGGLLVSLGALLGTVLPLLKPKRRGYSEWN